MSALAAGENDSGHTMENPRLGLNLGPFCEGGGLDAWLKLLGSSCSLQGCDNCVIEGSVGQSGGRE